jgi:hypothetical protein
MFLNGFSCGVDVDLRNKAHSTSGTTRESYLRRGSIDRRGHREVGQDEESMHIGVWMRTVTADVGRH